MFKKIVIAGLSAALLIERLRRIEERKKLPKMMISEVDQMLYQFNLSPEDRMAFKSLLVNKKIMEEKYTDVEIPFPNVHFYGRLR